MLSSLKSIKVRNKIKNKGSKYSCKINFGKQKIKSEINNKVFLLEIVANLKMNMKPAADIKKNGIKKFTNKI